MKMHLPSNMIKYYIRTTCVEIFSETKPECVSVSNEETELLKTFLLAHLIINKFPGLICQPIRTQYSITWFCVNQSEIRISDIAWVTLTTNFTRKPIDFVSIQKTSANAFQYHILRHLFQRYNFQHQSFKPLFQANIRGLVCKIKIWIFSTNIKFQSLKHLFIVFLWEDFLMRADLRFFFWFVKVSDDTSIYSPLRSCDTFWIIWVMKL